MFVDNLACATSCGEWSGVEWCVRRVVVRKVKVNYQHERGKVRLYAASTPGAPE